MNLYKNATNDFRVKKAQHLEKPDCVPVLLSDQLDFLSGWLDIKCDRYHIDAVKTLEAQAAFNKEFDGTGILGPNYGVAIEPSAFGAKIRFTDNTPPWVIHSELDLDDLEQFIEQLSEPDPMFSGLLPLYYQTYFSMYQITDGEIGAPLGAIAGIDIASLLVGFQNIAMGIKLYPEVIHKLLKKINAFLIQFIETKIELFEVKKPEMIDLYGDNAGYLSEADFLEFVAPYNKEIYDYFAESDTIKLYHCDGRLSHLLDALSDMGCNCLYSFDPTTDLSEFVKKLGNEMCLIGNIDPINVLRNGTKERVVEETKRLLDIGKKAKGFVLSTGGEVANGTPPENVRALLDTVKAFGHYE